MINTLVYCWELGGGLGHVTRMESVPKALEPASLEHVTYVMREPAKALTNGDVASSVLQAPLAQVDVKETSPNLSHVLWRNGWHDDDVAFELVKAWLNIFKEAQPTWVFLDHAPSAAVAADILGLSYFHFGNGFEIPPAVSPFPSIMPWQKVKPAVLQKWDNEVNERLKRVIKRLNRKSSLTSFRQLFSPQNSLIIAEPMLDHYADRKGEQKYLPLLSGKYIAPLFNQQPRTRPGLFVYLTAGTPELMNHLVELDKYFDVFGYVSGLSPAYSGALQAKGIKLSDKPLSMNEAMVNCDAVLCHGGMGTVSYALANHKALFLLPQHLEQQLTSYNQQKGDRAVVFGLGTDPLTLATTMASKFQQLKQQNQSQEPLGNEKVWQGSLNDFVLRSS